jgi:glyoxylase-like metal-dependent hydrolase (beta-lactamase superfamily II)
VKDKISVGADMSIIHPLHFPTSNAFLLMGTKPILVDSGSPGDLPAIKKNLQRIGIAPADIALLILTHAHFDHGGNVAAIREISGCQVAAHELEKPLMEMGKNAAMVPIHPLAKMLNPFMNFRFSASKVDITLQDHFDLKPFGADAQIILTPGHTPGSVSVITAEGEAIVGDLIGGGPMLGMFNPAQPRYHYWASNMDDVNASLQKLFAREITKIHVGHGGPLDGREAQNFFIG